MGEMGYFVFLRVLMFLFGSVEKVFWEFGRIRGVDVKTRVCVRFFFLIASLFSVLFCFRVRGLRKLSRRWRLSRTRRSRGTRRSGRLRRRGSAILTRRVWRF